MRWLLDLFWRVFDRWETWWYPPTHPGLNRLQLTWHRAWRRWVQSGLWSGWQRITQRLSDWWHPPEGGSLSRWELASLRRRRRREKAAKSARRGLLTGLGDWWNPASHPGISRLDLARLRLTRRWINSGFYVVWRAVLDRVDDAWRWCFRWTEDTLPETRDERFHRWLFRWQTAMVVVLLLGMGWGGLHYGRPWYRHYREGLYVRQAEQSLTQGNFKQALFRARLVLDRNAGNAAAVRVMAEIADQASSPQALYWRRRAFELVPSLTNRLALASTALRFERAPFPTATRLMNEVEPACRTNANYQGVAATLAARLGQGPETEQHLAELVRLNPTNKLNVIALASVQMQSADAAVRETGRGTLQMLAQDSTVASRALRPLVLNSFERKEYARAEKLSGRVLACEDAVFSDRLFHLGILRVEGSTNLSAFLADTQARAGTNGAQIAELCAWLNGASRSQQVLDWVGRLAPAIARQGLLPVICGDAYMALGQWARLESYLSGESWTGPKHVQMAMLARALAKQGKTEEESGAWQRALSAGAVSPEALKSLANMAAKWGWPARAEDVLWAAARKYPEQSWPLTMLGAQRGGKQGTEGLLRMTKMIYQKHPEDLQLGNDYATYALLLNQDMAQAVEIVAALYARAPTNAFIASTHAFALLKQGQAPKALEVMKQLDSAQLKIPAISAYFALVLAACGDTNAAQPYLNWSARGRLLPEEQVLIARARRGSAQLLEALRMPERAAGAGRE